MRGPIANLGEFLAELLEEFPATMELHALHVLEENPPRAQLGYKAKIVGEEEIPWIIFDAGSNGAVPLTTRASDQNIYVSDSGGFQQLPPGDILDRVAQSHRQRMVLFECRNRSGIDVQSQPDIESGAGEAE
jgi:hypothetical protein